MCVAVHAEGVIGYESKIKGRIHMGFPRTERENLSHDITFNIRFPKTVRMERSNCTDETHFVVDWEMMYLECVPHRVASCEWTRRSPSFRGTNGRCVVFSTVHARRRATYAPLRQLTVRAQGNVISFLNHHQYIRSV